MVLLNCFTQKACQSCVLGRFPCLRFPGLRVYGFFPFDRLSGYRLALCRNIGHASLASTLAMLDADSSSRQALSRWEHLLAGSILNDQQNWHGSWQNVLQNLFLFIRGVARLIAIPCPCSSVLAPNYFSKRSADTK